MTDWKPLTEMEATVMSDVEWKAWVKATHEEMRRLQIDHVRPNLDRSAYHSQREIIIARAIEGTLESCDKFMASTL